MRRIHFCRALSFCGLCFHLHLSAAILVGPGGASATFDTQPLPTDWSTRSIPGDNSIITDATQLDAAVQSLEISRVTQPLALSSVLPPNTAALAVWNVSAQNIQIRPTGVSYSVLWAILQNNTGGAASFLSVSYDFGSAYNENVNEAIPGWRAYFSLTGLPGSFEFIPTLSTSTPGQLNATLNLGSWANGSSLYLLWADDNGPGGAGGEPGATLEGAYTLDNFFVAVPEPSLMALALLGALAGLVVWRSSRGDRSMEMGSNAERSTR